LTTVVAPQIYYYAKAAYAHHNRKPLCDPSGKTKGNPGRTVPGEKEVRKGASPNIGKRSNSYAHTQRGETRGKKTNLAGNGSSERGGGSHTVNENGQTVGNVTI